MVEIGGADDQLPSEFRGAVGRRDVMQARGDRVEGNTRGRNHGGAIDARGLGGHLDRPGRRDPEFVGRELNRLGSRDARRRRAGADQAGQPGDVAAPRGENPPIGPHRNVEVGVLDFQPIDGLAEVDVRDAGAAIGVEVGHARLGQVGRRQPEIRRVGVQIRQGVREGSAVGRGRRLRLIEEEIRRGRVGERRGAGGEAVFQLLATEACRRDYFGARGRLQPRAEAPRFGGHACPSKRCVAERFARPWGGHCHSAGSVLKPHLRMGDDKPKTPAIQQFVGR